MNFWDGCSHFFDLPAHLTKTGKGMKRAMPVQIHRNLANSIVQKFSLFLVMKRRCFQDLMWCNVALLSSFTASNKKQKIPHWDDIVSDVIIMVASDYAGWVLNSAGAAIVGLTPIAA